MVAQERLMIIDLMVSLIENEKRLKLDKSIINDAREVIKQNVYILKQT